MRSTILARNFCITLFAFAAVASTRAALAADDAANAQPALSLSFESLSKPGMTDARAARLIALYVPQNTPPTPFLPPGAFKATWEGEINVTLRNDYNFTAAGTGKLTIKVGEKIAYQASGDHFDPNDLTGKSTRLRKGKNPITVTYESPATGDAWVRVYWSSAGEFLPEPIPPMVFSHSANSALTAATQLRQGRELIADLRCVRCHSAEFEPPTAMTELNIDAPSLEGIGSRLNAAWMARWISNPHALRPDTAMPRIATASDPQAAADLAAYLASLQAEKSAMEPDAANAEAGSKLIAQLGCIGCHSLPTAPPDAAADTQRVPWRNVRAKFRPVALVDFLKMPEKHFAWIGMPNFRLSDEEAKKIAAFLLKDSKEFDTPPVGDVGRGEKLFASAGCVACHATGAKQEPLSNLTAPALAAIKPDGWSRGCLASDGAQRGSAPDFALTPEQRSAIAAFAATDRSALNHDVLPEYAERQIISSRCAACHTRDEQPAKRDAQAAEAASLGGGDPANVETDPTNTSKVRGEPAPGSGDQSRPALTWVGEKLRPPFMMQMISGELTYKPRMWLTARMPGFTARAHGMAEGLAMEHGFPADAPVLQQTDADAAAIGRKLAGRDGGLSCINCHGIGNSPPTAPFEAPSINFRHMSDRLRKEYFDRWMRNPARVVPTTKMPSYATLEDGKLKNALRDVYEGDGTKQFDALWQFILAGDKIASPEEGK